MWSILPKKFDIAYREKLKQRGSPLSVSLELTNRCNLKCLHCYIRTDSEDALKKELKLTEIRDILRQLAEAGVIYLILTGGEVLLRPDFEDIYLFAKKQGLAVFVLTNGTLITDDLVELFRKYPPAILEISTYGLTSKTYEKITQVKGSFQKLQKNIDLLKKTNLRFILKLITIKSNYKEALNMKDIIRQSGVRCGWPLPLVLHRDRNIAMNSLIKKQRLSPQESVVYYNTFLKYNFNSESNLYDCDHASACGGGSFGCNITADGKLTRCHYFDTPGVDLRERRFIDAWNLLRESMAHKKEKELACGDCEFKHDCNWCPGIAYIETGRPDKKVEYLCKIMKPLTENAKNEFESRININIAGTNISIVSKDSKDTFLKYKRKYAEFITNNNPDVLIENRYDPLAETYLKDKELVLDNKYWSMYHDNSHRIFMLKSSRLSPKIVGVFNSNITKGNVYLKKANHNWLETRFGKIIILNLLSLRSKFIFHACGVGAVDSGEGFLFLGDPGTGKTTMAKLWSKRGYIVIHDDKIIVYKNNSNFFMSGLSWDSKFDKCSLTKRVLIKKIFFLNHGKKNIARRKKDLATFKSLTNRYLVPAWDRKGMFNAFSLCSNLAKKIPSYDLAFVPEDECIDFIKRIN